MTTLPPGVTLRQIDGGPTYFADHGFTYAVNMGWDNPNFFSIGIWAGTLSSSADAARWVDLGLNTAFGLGPSLSSQVLHPDAEQWDFVHLAFGRYRRGRHFQYCAFLGWEFRNR